MERTQIQLSAEQLQEVKAAAAARGLSIAAFIREAVADRLAAERRTAALERAIGSIGGFSSKEGDVSRRHDDYLAEIYAE